MGKLTVMKIRALRESGRVGDGGGLWLQVRGPERKSWLFRYQIAGKARTMGLGAWPAVGLADAREKAAECRRLLRDGVDPIAHRRASRQPTARTFREVADRYIAAHRAGWTAKHAREWEDSLRRFAYPTIGEMSVAAVDVGEVMEILEPLWSTKTETASRVRGRIESVLDYAKARKWRTGENPARWRGCIAEMLPKKAKVVSVQHFAALDWREMPAFMDELRKRTSIAALALRFVILTATRVNEALGARWEEIEGDVWTIPAGRTKRRREHRVSLSTAALAVLRDLPRLGPFLFPGRRHGRPLSSMALLMTLRRSGRRETVHGFRSAFRDWCAETTATSREVAAMALGHSIGDATEQAYRRGDLLAKRRELMQAWANYLTQV